MTPHFLTEIVALVVASAAIAYLGQRYLRIVPLVGFLLAGVLIGPNALGLVRDPELVAGAAEIGVILLLFTIGIEFSLERLGRIRRLILVGGGLQVALTVGLVTLLLGFAGVGWRAGVFTGCLVALSSTVIVLKLLGDRGQTGSEPGQAALAILLFQDLAVVGMVLLVPILAGGESTGGGAIAALGKAALIIAVVLVLARRVMPPFLERVARTCSPDIFLLTVIAVGLGTAWLSSLAGLSVSLGAFLAGLVVSESRFSEHAFSELLPLRILFSAAFFISVGMLLDPRFLLEHPLLVAVAVVGVLAVKLLTTGAGLLALGRPLPVAAASALLVAQVGEFSFVLEGVGRQMGLYPAGSELLGGQTFIAATVLLMIATPVWADAAWRLQRRLGSRASAAAAGETGGLHDHVIVAGYGAQARRIVASLTAAGVPHVVLTLSPEGAAEAESDGRRVLRGDYTRRAILESAGIERARVLVVADDEPETAGRTASVARMLGPRTRIVAAVRHAADVAGLVRVGADRAVAEEEVAARELVRETLAFAGVDAARAELLAAAAGDGDGIDRLYELSAETAEAAGCAHAGGLEPVRPRTPAGCEECLRSGDGWVHLRLCLTCGHVGCCDSSPGRHATAHHAETGHPLIRSLEKAEEWSWCYEDRITI